jgi:hypothetical protein
MVLAWRHRDFRAGLCWLAIATFICRLAFKEAHYTTLERQLLFNNFGYFGSMSVPVAWFLLTCTTPAVPV